MVRMIMRNPMPALVTAIMLSGAIAAGWAQPTLAQQTDAKAAKAANNDELSQLRKRVEQLEEQLVDINVIVGTLETLARSGGAARGATVAPSFGPTGSAGDGSRISALETQVRALTAQIQQMGAQSPRQDSAAPAVRNQGPAVAAVRPQAGRPSDQSGFGSTSITPVVPPSAALQFDTQGAGTAQLDPLPAPEPSTVSSGGPQGDYEAAYGHLLQQDYGAAQAAFSDFLKRHPKHALAGNAQYWLGETYYVRGQYKSAAGAFLKGYRQFGSSIKAPDSLLKLSMSLDRLGQRAAACSSLEELTSKYPRAAAHVRRRARQERSRLSC